MSIVKPIADTQYQDSLKQALALQLACASVGFDWPSAEPVFEKVIEELEEIKEAIANPNKKQADIAEEMGDLLFVCVNLSRHLAIDPSEALVNANQKFANRFAFIEERLSAQNKAAEDCSLEALEALWQDAKNAKINDGK